MQCITLAMMCIVSQIYHNRYFFKMIRMTQACEIPAEVK